METQLRARWYQGPTGQARSQPLPDPTLGELAEAYCEGGIVAGVACEGLSARGKRPNTIATTPCRLWSIVRALGPDRLARSIDNAVMDSWLSARRRSTRLVRAEGGKMRPSGVTISPTTVHNEEAALRALFRWAIRKRLLRDPEDPRRTLQAVPWELAPEDKPRPRTHRPRRIPDGHVRALAEGLDPMASDVDLYLLLGLLWGPRAADLESLTWEHLLGPLGAQETAKTGAWVHRSLPPPLRRSLARMGGVGRVFEAPPSPRRIRRRMRQLCGEEYGIKALRHTVATGLALAGVHPRLSKAVLGHAIRDVTEGYQEPSPAEVGKAVEGLWWVRVLMGRAKDWGQAGGESRGKQAG